MRRLLPLLLLLAGASVARADETVVEARARFDEAVSSGKEADAQAAGKRLLSEFPEDPTCLYVLREYLERGWRWPRLKTSFPTLKRWEQDEVDGAREPDLRLALIDALEGLYPREDHVREGGTLYERAWTHLKADRAEESVKAGREYLRRFPGGSSADKVRLVIAEALLRSADEAGARKVLEPVLADPGSKHHERARALVDEAAGGRWPDLAKGLPRASGLGTTVLLTDLPTDGATWKALARWREARGVEVVRFRSGRLSDAADALRKIGPEYVAVAVSPAEVDTNLQFELVSLCRDLDDDAMPDFLYGFLVARDADDLAALADRSLAAAPREGAKLRNVNVPTVLGNVEGLDGFVHFGHGMPNSIVDGLTAAAVSSGALPQSPLVVSGACFNGVVARSWHPCTFQPSWCRAVEYSPDQVLPLAWIHAGAIGVVAPMEGDRGEMAGAEWAWLRQTACPLGELPALSQRLAFAVLPEPWAGMPRQRAGAFRSLHLRDVMLRGQLSRALIGDPSVRLLAEPLDARAADDSVALDESGRVVVEVRPNRHVFDGESQFLFVNTVTGSGMSGMGFTERRLWARVELPAGAAGRLGPPEVSVEREGKPVPTIRSTVRHEVWGGKRFVLVHVESGDNALLATGTRARFVFPVAR